MTANRKSILLVGNAPYGNRGCEAIVRSTADILTAHWPDARYILCGLGGEDAIRDARNEFDSRIKHIPHKAYWYRRFDPDWWRFRVFHRHSKLWQNGASYRSEFLAAQHSMVALQIGGDNYSLDYGKPQTHLELDRLLKVIGIPLVLWGASVGPFTNDPDFERRMRDHLMLFDLILARESETVAYLASLGIVDQVRLVADPAFVLKAERPACAAELMRFLNRRPIGLNLSPLVGRYRMDGGASWTAVVKACVDQLLKANVGPILLVPHVVLHGDDDYAFLEDIRNLTEAGQDQLMIVPPNLRASEYKWVISKLRAFIGARTHATIAALSSNIPTISIGYSMKSSGINKDIFTSNRWVIPVQDVTPFSLVSKLKELTEVEVDVRELLVNRIPSMSMRARSAAGHVSEMLTRRAGSVRGRGFRSPH